MTKTSQTKFKETELGLIPEDWEVLKARDFCSKVADGTHDSPKSTDQGKYLITSRHLKNNKIDFDNAYLISEDDYENIKKRSEVNSGDILYSMIGTVGEICQVKEREVNFAIKNIGLFKPKSILNSNWLYYYLQSNQSKEYLQSRLAGSTQSYITLDQLREFPIAFPKKESEQRKIAEVLGALDEKIELNRRMNKTLDSLAQAIFQKWFIDNESTTECKIGDVIEIFDSKRVPLSSRERENRKGTYPYYGATSIMDYVDGFIFDDTYLLLGEDGSVARDDGTPFTQYVWGKIWVNNHAHVLKGKNGFSTELIKVFFDNIDIKPYITGAVQQKLNQENLKSIPINIPADDVLAKVNQTIKPLFEKIKTNSIEIETLSQIRDSLLPRLMSGKLRVK
jgi:type I restriction enzyme S subunit